MPEHSFIGWIVIGLVAGVLGKLIMPGRDPGGFVVTILLGIAGALLAGLVARIVGLSLDSAWASYGAAIVGAVAILAIYRLIMHRRAAR